MEKSDKFDFSIFRFLESVVINALGRKFQCVCFTLKVFTSKIAEYAVLQKEFCVKCNELSCFGMLFIKIYHFTY